MSQATGTLTALQAAQVIAVLRSEHANAAIRTAEALLEGGIRAIELTFTTRDVERALSELVESHPSALIGAGTITNARQASVAAAAGAAFLVSPASPPALIADMRATGLTTIAGCLTPTEILVADQAGADAIKVFPADAVGPTYLVALRGPFPELKLIPTGGISPADVPRWIEAGALAVGIGGRLARPVDDDHDHRAVVTMARELGVGR